MATTAEDGGLAANSPWRTDTSVYSAVITYNEAAGKPVEILTGANSFALSANQVNVTDFDACGGGVAPATTPGY